MTDVTRIEISLSLEVTAGGLVTICEVSAKAPPPEKAAKVARTVVDLVRDREVEAGGGRGGERGGEGGPAAWRISQGGGGGRPPKQVVEAIAGRGGVVVAAAPEPVERRGGGRGERSLVPRG